MWDYTDEQAFIPPWNVLDENATQGYDNYDLWGQWGPNPDGWDDWTGRRSDVDVGGDYETHYGTNEDLHQ